MPKFGEGGGTNERSIKTSIVFDGSAGKGAVGDSAVLAVTGRIRSVRMYRRILAALVSADDANDTITLAWLGTPTTIVGRTVAQYQPPSVPSYGDGDGGYTEFHNHDLSVASVDVLDGDQLGFTITGNAVTAGELELELFYIPMPDGGSVAAV